MFIRSRRSNESFSDLLKTPWIRSSIKWAIVFTLIAIIVVLVVKLFNLENTQLFSEMEIFFTRYGFPGIFFATILAGTLVPLGSPALVVAAALFGLDPAPLVIIATVGFTIGMTINYALAYKLGRPYVLKKVPVQKLDEVLDLWNRWGWTIYVLFGLIPVLPVELLSFICGLLKTRLLLFWTLSFVPRLIVFAVLAYFGDYAGVWIGIT